MYTSTFLTIVTKAVRKKYNIKYHKTNHNENIKYVKADVFYFLIIKFVQLLSFGRIEK